MGPSRRSRRPSPRGRVLVIAGIALMLAGGVVGATGFASATDPPPPALDDPTVTPDPVDPKMPATDRAPDSQITADQSSQADSIATSDPDVQAMLGSRPYTVSDTASWNADSQQTIGAIVTLSFDQPQDLTGNWTVVTTAPGSTPAYTLARESYTTVHGATDVDVWVDLGADKAVGIMPEGDVTTN